MLCVWRTECILFCLLETSISLKYSSELLTNLNWKEMYISVPISRDELDPALSAILNTGIAVQVYMLLSLNEFTALVSFKK
jgi:hypothetical protein